MAFDFANILFSGACNARCPTCIGRQVDPRLNGNNLDVFPPRNLERFITLIEEHGIEQAVFSGTTTDPQLYRHEARLLAMLRRRLGRQVKFSLHTNGRLALHKMEIFNQYDRVSLSFPSFEPATYQRMMGVPNLPNLVEIIRRAQVALKISCLVTEENAHELATFLARCQALGIRRVVLRKLHGDQRPWAEWIDAQAAGLRLCGDYRANPVYDYGGMEVTLWDFELTESRSINLFGSGAISASYHLVEARAKGMPAPPAASQSSLPADRKAAW
jgi:molybdenum cofactor biosynthesis enzyme MoaA